MINLTLPDGKILQHESSITGLDIANSISKSLAKKSVAIAIDGELIDLSIGIDRDASIKIITSEDKEGLEILRHDAAHLLAQAIKNLFPSTQITIGPVIENGFYYDVLPKEQFSEKDLLSIEKEMHKISQSNIPITREIWNRDEAIKFFEGIGETFKAEIISDLPNDEEISLYRQGEFVDLCRGPHSPSTKFVKHFKLMKIAGAYWRGDSNNIMLQRIYGTAWATKEDLDQHLYMLEEAERRDHRKLAKQLDLFHMQEESPGMVFWHHNGWTIYRMIQEYVRNKITEHGYIEVNTPILASRKLWERSGHWEKFGENMFSIADEEKSIDMKPMNCPCHIEIFKTGIRSYRDLPIRMAEFGCCHRNEPSGSLHGLMRVRAFSQDDAHIFCTEDQITSETVRFTELLREIYKDFGFEEILVKFADRPDTRAGDDKIWDKAENSLQKAMTEANLDYALNKGEGAFYGPKIEFYLKDSIGREWQCGTLQLDFVLAERLGATYIQEDGSKKNPVIIHRAVLGSLERFIGILIENYEGKFPLWLASQQVAILTITTDVEDYATKLQEKLSDYRVILDASNEKINAKIRKNSLLKIPIIAIIGREEQSNESVSIREFGSNNQVNFGSIDEFKKYLDNKIKIKE